jgi:hypothetical protein
VFRGLRKKRSSAAPQDEAHQALDAFLVIAGLTDRAKQSLLAAAPGGRGEGAPLAEALAGFEEHLQAARRSLDTWPASLAGSERKTTVNAIEGSLRRAETLRLDASPRGYEELYALLGDALDPLDAMAEVAERLRHRSS